MISRIFLTDPKCDERADVAENGLSHTFGQLIEVLMGKGEAKMVFAALG